MRKLRASQITYLAAALALMIAVFSVAAPSAFLSAYNIQTILTVTSVLLVVSVGMTFVIATAGIDLSVGSVLVFSAVMSLKTMTALGGTGFGTVLAGFAVAVVSGLAWGTLNGLLVAKAKVPALISTLGTMGAALGIAQLVTGGNDLSGVPKALYESVGLGQPVRRRARAWLVIRRRRPPVAGPCGAYPDAGSGRYTLFTGSGPEVGRRAGFNVDLALVTGPARRPVRGVADSRPAPLAGPPAGPPPKLLP